MKNRQYQRSSPVPYDQFKKQFRQQAACDRQFPRMEYRESPGGDTFVLEAGISKLKGRIRDVPGSGSEIIWKFTKQLALKILLAVPLIVMIFAVAYYLIVRAYAFAMGVGAAALIYVCLASLFMLYIPRADRQKLTEQLEMLSDHKEE